MLILFIEDRAYYFKGQFILEITVKSVGSDGFVNSAGYGAYRPTTRDISIAY